MRNLLIMTCLGLVAGTALVEAVAIPLWFGYTANLSIAAQHCFFLVFGAGVFAGILKHTGYWQD